MCGTTVNWKSKTLWHSDTLTIESSTKRKPDGGQKDMMKMLCFFRYVFMWHVCLFELPLLKKTTGLIWMNYVINRISLRLLTHLYSLVANTHAYKWMYSSCPNWYFPGQVPPDLRGCSWWGGWAWAAQKNTASLPAPLSSSIAQNDESCSVSVVCLDFISFAFLFLCLVLLFLCSSFVHWLCTSMTCVVAYAFFWSVAGVAKGPYYSRIPLAGFLSGCK